MDAVTKLTSQRAVVVFSKSSCCMSHTVVRLFIDLGVNATVHELDEDPRGSEIECALAKLLGRSPAIPAVYIGGRLVGSTDNIMSLHMSVTLCQCFTMQGLFGCRCHCNSIPTIYM